MALIPIDSELKDFKKYLNFNDRCVFSARFGDGKSYFLSKFIKNIKSNIYLFLYIEIVIIISGYATSLVVDIFPDNGILKSFPTNVLLNGGYGKQSSDAILAEKEFILNYFAKYLNNSRRHSILR